MHKGTKVMTLVFLLVGLSSLVDDGVLFTDLSGISITALASKAAPQERANNTTEISGQIGGIVTFFEYPTDNHSPFTVYSTDESRWEYSNAFNESTIEILCNAACQNISDFVRIKVFDPDYYKFPHLNMLVDSAENYYKSYEEEEAVIKFRRLSYLLNCRLESLWCITISDLPPAEFFQNTSVPASTGCYILIGLCSVATLCCWRRRKNLG